MLAYAMTPLHGRSDDVPDYSKLTLSGGTALYSTITRYAYTAARAACILRKIDTIRESMPGNANSPQVPRRGPRMSPGRGPQVSAKVPYSTRTDSRLGAYLYRSLQSHSYAPGPPPQCLPML